MSDARPLLFDLIAGRWRSQAIYAGVRLGIFDVVTREPTTANETARKLGLDPAMTYRLMRALGSIGVLREHAERAFSLTDMGQLLRSDDPQSLRGVVLLREGPEHYAVWKHLSAIVRDGRQNGFEREFGVPAFEHAAREPAYAAAFDEGMNSYSRVQTAWVMEALRDDDFKSAKHVCDIGGGHGHLLCHLLIRYPHLTGTVVERPAVLAQPHVPWAQQLGVADRCRYVGADMFAEVPAADVYLLKMILHNWSDDECLQILRVAHQSASAQGRVFVIEHVIPALATPHIAKLFDLHMMTWGTGRERSEDEYAALLRVAGWDYVETRYPLGAAIGLVAGRKRVDAGA